jgi:hypothetical protein
MGSRWTVGEEGRSDEVERNNAGHAQITIHDLQTRTHRHRHRHKRAHTQHKYTNIQACVSTHTYTRPFIETTYTLCPMQSCRFPGATHGTSSCHRGRAQRERWMTEDIFLKKGTRTRTQTRSPIMGDQTTNKQRNRHCFEGATGPPTSVDKTPR